VVPRPMPARLYERALPRLKKAPLDKSPTLTSTLRQSLTIKCDSVRLTTCPVRKRLVVYLLGSRAHVMLTRRLNARLRVFVPPINGTDTVSPKY
jgi:hypothetical protein